MAVEPAVCAFCLKATPWKDSDLPGVERANQDRHLRMGWTKLACDWVCRDCERSGAALRACPRKQTWEGFRWPYLSFADFPGTCGLCRESFVFSAAEQQHWYEELAIPLEVVPNNCAPCREKLRAQKRDQESLCALLEQPQGPDDYESIGEIYARAGRMGKAVEALRRARNLQADETSRARLKTRIDELKNLPNSSEPWPASPYSSNPHFYWQQRHLRCEAVIKRRKELGARG